MSQILSVPGLGVLILGVKGLGVLGLSVPGLGVRIRYSRIFNIKMKWVARHGALLGHFKIISRVTYIIRASQNHVTLKIFSRII